MLGRSMPSGFRANVKATGEEMQRERLMERLRQTFRPEFLNRVDEVVIFQPLGQEQARAITRLQMNELGARLLEQGLVLNADDSAIELLCKEGFSQTQGARPLRRAPCHRCACTSNCLGISFGLECCELQLSRIFRSGVQ